MSFVNLQLLYISLFTFTESRDPNAVRHRDSFYSPGPCMSAVPEIQDNYIRVLTGPRSMLSCLCDYFPGECTAENLQVQC